MFSVCQHSARVDHKVSQMICSFDHCSSPYRKHVETTALKCKKGLSVLKAMSIKGIEQRHLFLLSHNNGTDKSAKAGQSAERGNEGDTENHHGHTH